MKTIFCPVNFSRRWRAACVALMFTAFATASVIAQPLRILDVRREPNSSRWAFSYESTINARYVLLYGTNVAAINRPVATNGPTTGTAKLFSSQWAGLSDYPSPTFFQIQAVPLAPSEQTTITGRVLDADGATAAGVQIQLNPFASLVATTGADGQFRIETVPATEGKIYLSATRLRNGTLDFANPGMIEPAGGTVMELPDLRLRSLESVPRQQLGCGDRYSSLLDKQGRLWCWGGGPGGIPGGNPPITNFTYPVLVITNKTWHSVSIRSEHALGLAVDGTLWSWGKNVGGQLGIGKLTNFYSGRPPFQIGTNLTWQVVCAGLGGDGIATSFAIATDGTLWGWGDNFEGQLGIGRSLTRYEFLPIHVGSNLSWQAVSASLNYTLALAQDGTMWAWGSNEYGQLGNGSKQIAFFPTQIGTNNNWLTVVAGGAHNLALRTDGSL